MRIGIALLTYFAYAFVVVAYTIKAKKYFTLPPHIRWDLYPVMHEEHAEYGGSYYEHVDWWTKKRKKHWRKSILYLLREYLFLGSYYRIHKDYWLALYLAHAGFIFLILFQILCLTGGTASVFGVGISRQSGSVAGRGLYYVALATGLCGFIAGALGNAGLLVKRATDRDLRLYASPLIYFGYLFHVALSLSGLYAWYYVDPTFSEYRRFWSGLVTLRPVQVQTGLAVFILLLAVHLIYLPFTRAFHYISRILAFFLIRWDDEPNVRGGKLERRLERLLCHKVTWSGPHIGAGRTWGEIAKDEKP
jgi:nitrate reductase gamma subunit